MKTPGEHYLYPGTVFVNEKPFMVTTVLGSCVSVCLWDPVLKLGGINHFQLSLWNGDGLATPKYGNIAIEKLITKMQDLGSKKKDIKAKVFGGGAVLSATAKSLNIGEQNIMVALDILQQERIPIISSAVGGNSGRKLRYYTETGVVLVKLVGKRK